jgi:two-component system KDP operon response regulator KdpE
LSINLRARKYDVHTAATGADALAEAARHPPDLVVLDLGLPDMDGVDVVTGLRGWTSTPILVLSAREGSGDKVAALDAGADDYVTKPFGTDELLARLRAVLRRAGEHGAPSRVELGDLTIDLDDRTVSRAGTAIHLTPIEFDLLRVLAQHHGRLVTQRQLLQDVWGPQYVEETHYLRVHIAHIRAKVEPDPSRPRFLITEPGVGYRLRDSA